MARKAELESNIKEYCTFRGSHWHMFFKIGILKDFAYFTRKHSCWSLFLTNVIKKSLQNWCYFTNKSGWRGGGGIKIYKNLTYANRGRGSHQCKRSHINCFNWAPVPSTTDNQIFWYFVSFIKMSVLLKISVLKKLYLVRA